MFNKLIDEMTNSGGLVNRIIWIPGAVCADIIPGDLRDFINYIVDDILYNESKSSIFNHIKELKDSIKNEDFSDYVQYILTNYNGFLFEAAAPNHLYFNDDSYSVSWGNYVTEWFYAETVEEIPNIIAKWINKNHMSN